MIRPSPPPLKTYTSHEYTQKVVPLFSEVSRSKALFAEASLLMERNQSVLVRPSSFEAPIDDSAILLETLPSSDSLPLLLLSKSSDRAEVSISHPSISGHRRKNQGTSLSSDVAVAALEGHPTKRDSMTTADQVERLLPFERQLSKSLFFEKTETEVSFPEQSYADYLKTRSLPHDKNLPQLKPPSASLLQGTAASSLRRLSLASASSPVKDSYVSPARSVVPSASLLAGTTASQKKVSTPSKSPASLAASLSASLSASPTRALTPRRHSTPVKVEEKDRTLYRRRHSTGAVAPGPLPATIPQKESSLGRRSSTSTAGFPKSIEKLINDPNPLTLDMLLTRKVTPALTNRGFLKQALPDSVPEKNSSMGMNVRLPIGENELINQPVVVWTDVSGMNIDMIDASLNSKTDYLVVEKRRADAARCIARMFLKRRAELNKARATLYNVSLYFFAAIRIWRKRRAATILKDFLHINFTVKKATRLFAKADVLRFTHKVRIIQNAWRTFSSCKKRLIAKLTKVWDSYEGNYIRHQFKTVQEKYRETLTSSHIVVFKRGPRRSLNPSTQERRPSTAVSNQSQRRNSAPGSRVPLAPTSPLTPPRASTPTVDSDFQMLEVHAENDLSHSTPYLPELSLETTDESGKDTGCYTTSKLIWQERRWCHVDNKFSSLLTKYDRKKTERQIVANYILTIEEKKSVINRIYIEARRRRMAKYDESMELQQMALEKNDVFSITDAISLIRNSDDKGLMSIVKHRINQVELFNGASDSKKRCLPFIFYSSVVNDNIIYRCIRDTHKQKMTYDFIYEHYSRFH